MAWLRIDENAMDHPKIAALTDGAFRLWVSGLAYCQKHLTDGHIPRTVLRGLRGMSRGRADELTACGLWDAQDDGFQVHDYLKWNDSRERVLEMRAFGRERLERLRGKKRNPTSRSKRVTTHERTRSVLTQYPHGEGSDLVSSEDLKEENEEKKQIGAFIKAFCDLYKQHRHGATYHVQSTKHVPLIRSLLKDYGADRLGKLAKVLLLTEDPWVSDTDRGIGVLSVKAAWLDDRLAEAEAKQRTAVS